MIYTLTMNPSLDYVMEVDKINIGGVNRSHVQRVTASGKGVNVSRALKAQGIVSRAICIVGDGFAGREFTRLLKTEGFDSVIVASEGCDTRINVKLRSQAVTEINGDFTADEMSLAAMTMMLAGLKQGDFLIISGSIPKGVPARIYAALSAELTLKGVTVAVDTSGDALREVVLNKSAWLIAPNEHELAQIAEMFPKLENMNILASYGESGATLTTADGAVYTSKPARTAQNGYTVGAGDVLLAGFVASFIKSNDYEKSLAAGVNAATEYVCK
ncbi:MAG: 1-phosphofructokinase family hexose kinase [Oscillospiraceae bacterium]|nr:1-phosphofructokinase family hexose kinase [Oscillospiraceae bacterium]